MTTTTPNNRPATKANGHIRPYTAKNGRQMWRPSLPWAMTLNARNEGFCLACAESVAGIEPDARRCTCPACGEAKVYGAEELVMMGLTFDKA